MGVSDGSNLEEASELTWYEEKVVVVVESPSALATGGSGIIVDQLEEETSAPLLLPAAAVTVADRRALPRTSRLVDKAPTTVTLVASVSRRVVNDAYSDTMIQLFALRLLCMFVPRCQVPML